MEKECLLESNVQERQVKLDKTMDGNLRCREKIDILNRDEFINHVVKIVNKISDNKGNVTFSINGEWGCGKTFVLEKIQERLDNDGNKKFLVIPYNCWQYDYYDEPLVAIVAALLNFCESKKIIDKDTITALRRILEILGEVAVTTADMHTGFTLTTAFKGIKNIFKKVKLAHKESHKYDIYYDFKKVLLELKKQLKKLSEQYTIVFAVDELDRCLPEYAIKVLERLHHVSEGVPNMVTIIAVDKKRLEHTVGSIFGDESADNYLKKFIKFERELDNGSQDASKFSEKFQYFCNRFDAYLWPLDKKKEEQFIKLLFSDIDIRLQEEIVEETKIFHDLCFKNEKEKPACALMYMELFIVTLYRAYNLNFPDMPQKFKFYFQNKNRVMIGATGKSDDIFKIAQYFTAYFQQDFDQFCGDKHFFEINSKFMEFKDILLFKQPRHIHLEKRNSSFDLIRPQQPAIIQQPAIRKCAKCGDALLDNSLYCHSCGAKRRKCSCGEFLDAGMNFCPKCGKMLPETKQLQQQKERERQEEINNLAIEWGFKDLHCEFIDKGDYIEVIPPIDYKDNDREILIQMIEKGCSGKAMNWKDANKYAKQLTKGGFSDWRIPTVDELKIIYKFKDKICSDQKDVCFCASTTKSDDTDGAYYMDFNSGLVSRDDTKSGDAYVRCVRYSETI